MEPDGLIGSTMNIKVRWLLIAAIAGLWTAFPLAQARTFKLAFYNIRSGEGIQALPGHASPFPETLNCDPKAGALNAWGIGMVQKELVKVIKEDSSVLALGLAEAWNCGAPENVRRVLEWKAHSSERNGVSLLARYGFSGDVDWLQVDTSKNKNPRDTMWVVHGRVCSTPSCSASLDVYAAHWSGTGPEGPQTSDRQAQQTIEFMSKPAAPHALIGDLNVFEGHSDVCGQQPNNTSLVFLRRAGYTDAWPSLHGTAEGYTGMLNRAGCGVPEGYPWKRIDYAWSKGLTPVSMQRFGLVRAGDAAPSDHLGIIVEYAFPTGGSRP